jgi:hypothetical protein
MFSNTPIWWFLIDFFLCHNYLTLKVIHCLYCLTSLVYQCFICTEDFIPRLLIFLFPCTTAAGPPSPAEHLREVFYRMGLNDKVCTECCVRIKHGRILDLLLTIILYSVGNCCTVRSSYTWTGKTRA